MSWWIGADPGETLVFGQAGSEQDFFDANSGVYAIKGPFGSQSAAQAWAGKNPGWPPGSSTSSGSGSSGSGSGSGSGSSGSGSSGSGSSSSGPSIVSRILNPIEALLGFKPLDLQGLIGPLGTGAFWERGAEIALGFILIAIGVARLTNAIPAATKIARAVS